MLLGTNTITCDNAHATKPFGTIDFPSQGGVISGSSYRNHGWVLTPQPCGMPLDGSTMVVYIDGVGLGGIRCTTSTGRTSRGCFRGWWTPRVQVGTTIQHAGI